MPFWSWVRKCASNSGVPKRRSPPGCDRSNTSQAPTVTSATWAFAFWAFAAHFCGQPLQPSKLQWKPLAAVFTVPSTTPQPSMAPLVILNVALAEAGALRARVMPTESPTTTTRDGGPGYAVAGGLP